MEIVRWVVYWFWVGLEARVGGVVVQCVSKKTAMREKKNSEVEW